MFQMTVQRPATQRCQSLLQSHLQKESITAWIEKEHSSSLLKSLTSLGLWSQYFVQYWKRLDIGIQCCGSNGRWQPCL